MNKNKKLPIYISIIGSLVVCLSIGGVSFAKYYAERYLGEQEVIAKEFYFTVDLLGDTNNLTQSSKSFDLYGDKEKTIDFSVRNYFDSLRVNTTEFNYNVNVNVLNDLDYEPILVSASTNDNYFAHDVKEDENYTITFPSGFENGTKVVVNINSSSPYVKEMELIFNLYNYESAVTYKVDDKSGSPYASLLIYCNENIKEKEILIDWSSINSTANVFQIDMTNSYILDGNEFITNAVDENIGYLTKAYNTISINQGEVIEILFFKANSNLDYSMDNTSSTYVDNVYKIQLTYK